MFIYLLLIAGDCSFDRLQAAREKISKNAARYPVDLCHGSATKRADPSRPIEDRGATDEAERPLRAHS
ncbi:MAG TPA: hypothetical protein DEQ40_20090 [Oxalobacteraceae bacterium]|nr:hypothetical protein [Oxalobacteraceae bacterium]